MATNYVVKNGDIGITVNKLQGYLNIFQSRGFIPTRVSQDGIFGSGTRTAVQQYQRYAGLSVDGVVGNVTWDSMVNKLRSLGVFPNIPVASSSYYLSVGQTGLGVYKQQQYLNAIAATRQCLKPITADGDFGNQTKQAVMQYQYIMDLTIDGVIGSKTWDSIVNEYLRIR